MGHFADKEACRGCCDSYCSSESLGEKIACDGCCPSLCNNPKFADKTSCRQCCPAYCGTKDTNTYMLRKACKYCKEFGRVQTKPKGNNKVAERRRPLASSFEHVEL